MSRLKTRKPTGRVPWPLILLEGGEKAGKSWAAAEFSGSSKVGQTLWIDLTEGGADEYGKIPGADYEILIHDGTWHSILDQVIAAKETAEQAVAAGHPPVVLVIDNMTALWDLLKDWATWRASKTATNKEKLRKDPNAEIKVAPNFWNDANARWRKLMTILMTFPGIVVVLARGKEVAALDGNGRPIEGSREYKVESQKNLGFDVSVWVRVSREHPPMIIGARSVHAGRRPGVDEPKPVKDFSLEWLVFDVLRCEPATAHVRDLVTPNVTNDPGDATDGGDPLQRLGELFQHAGWSDKADMLRATCAIVGRRLTSATDLTAAEIDAVSKRLTEALATNDAAAYLTNLVAAANDPQPSAPTATPSPAEPQAPAVPATPTAPRESAVNQAWAANAEQRLTRCGDLREIDQLWAEITGQGSTRNLPGEVTAHLTSVYEQRKTVLSGGRVAVG